MKKYKTYKRKSLARIIGGWLFFILMLVAVVFLGVHIATQSTTVSGNSMYPVLRDGDRILIDSISYHFLDPSRNDLIVFTMPHQEGAYAVKRVIGLPGESVQIMDGNVYINGSVLDGVRDTYAFPGLASALITLGEDEYFVLGDNASDSSDSREPTIGNIKRDSIIGHVIFRVGPLNRIGLVR